MSRTSAIAILLVSALLEAGGDAIVRIGLKNSAPLTKAALFALGALVLFAYGYTVNAPPWDFGRLLGLYVVFFFATAQLISWVLFAQPPGRAVWLGGAFIIAGGLIIAISDA